MEHTQTPADRAMSPLAVISWTPQDLMNEYGMDLDRAEEVLWEISGYLEARSIETGWDILSVLVAPYLNDEE